MPGEMKQFDVSDKEKKLHQRSEAATPRVNSELIDFDNENKRHRSAIKVKESQYKIELSSYYFKKPSEQLSIAKYEIIIEIVLAKKERQDDIDVF